MFEAYKIGIRLSLINHASIGLLGLSRDFMKTEEQASKLQKRIESIQNQALKGGLLLGAGVALGGLLKAPYEQAKALAQQQEKFAALNLSAADNAKVYAQAQALAHKNLGSTIAENIGLIRDLHTAMGDLPHALAASDAFSQYSIAAKIQNDGKPVEGLIYNASKALEHRGDRVMQNPEEYQRELAMQSRLYFATGGKVGPDELFHASQTGKMSYALFDPEFLYGQYAALIQQKTGSTAGTAGMTYLSSILGGHMDNKAKDLMLGLGLWDVKVSDQAKAQQNAINAAISADPEMKGILKKQGLLTPVVGALPSQYVEMAAHRPDVFVDQVLAPAIRKRFGMDLTDDQVALIITKSFNRGTSDFIGSLIQNQVKYEKDAKIYQGAKDFSGAYHQYIKSPEGAEVAASAAWTNFLAVFGSVYLPTITKGLLAIAGGLDSLSKTVEEHPAAFKALAYALGAVAIGLGLKGGGLLLSAALRGFGLALAMQAVGGASGIAKIAMAIGGVGKAGLVGSLGLLISPLGLVIAAVVGLGAILYAVASKAPTQAAIDSYKDGGGAHLSAGAAARVANGDLAGMESTSSPFIAPGSGKMVQVQSTLNVDGRKFAESVTTHQVRGMGTSLTGGQYDFGLGLPSVGMKY